MLDNCLNKREDIDNFKLNELFIEKKIEEFMVESGAAEDTIKNLFKKADNKNFDNVFCRVACIDLIYSTQIQRFSRNGIVTVAEHIIKLASDIDEVVKKRKFDYELYKTMVEVDFFQGNDEKKTRRLYSFASKFLSFTLPDVYPIMDSKVRTILGLAEDVSYEDYSKILICIRDKYKEIGIDKTLKEWDMCLWQWEKELEEG